jgi:hypothetical protein
MSFGFSTISSSPIGSSGTAVVIPEGAVNISFAPTFDLIVITPASGYAVTNLVLNTVVTSVHGVASATAVASLVNISGIAFIPVLSVGRITDIHTATAIGSQPYTGTVNASISFDVTADAVEYVTASVDAQILFTATGFLPIVAQSTASAEINIVAYGAANTGFIGSSACTIAFPVISTASVGRTSAASFSLAPAGVASGTHGIKGTAANTSFVYVAVAASTTMNYLGTVNTIVPFIPYAQCSFGASVFDPCA